MITVSPRVLRGARGFALVAVLWIVLIAGVILMGVNQSARMNFDMAHSDLESVQARWLARAGIEQALAVLEDDPTAVDGVTEDWYDSPALFKEVELSGGVFSCLAPPDPPEDPRVPRYGLIDHGGRLNVNVADDKQLAALPDVTAQQVDCILDWRDADDEVRPNGAERGYYQRLKFPYDIRNGLLRTLQELRLIRGIDDLAFYGEDTDLDGVLGPGEDDLNASWPPDNGDGQLNVGLAGLTTVYSYELNRRADGGNRLNIRTADKNTLMKELNFSDALAQAVMNSRPSSLMDLLAVRPRTPGAGPSGGANPATPGSAGPPSGSPAPSPSPTPASPAAGSSALNQVTLAWLAEHLDELTLSDQERLPGRVNVNTAKREVLMTLPEIDGPTADAILGRQSSSQGSFGSVGELLDSGTVTEGQFKAMAERVTARSSVFEVRSVATTSGGFRHTIVAVVDRGVKPMTILYWWQSE